MNEAATFALILCSGGLIGVIFYGGLLWTVQKGMQSLHPALWFLCSFWIRIAIVLGGFYRITGSDWKKLLICMAGFLLARAIVTHLAQRVFRAH